MNQQPRVPAPDAPLPPMPGAFPNPPSVNRLPPLPPSSPGNDWVVDFEDVEAYNKAKVAGRLTSRLMNEWLKSEANWKYRIGKNWRGKKVLGLGGQGIVGHWTYEGEDRDQKTVKDIAVKQALRSGPAYKWGDGLETEALWLQKFARARSPHIIRMYKHLFEEQGQRTIDKDWGVVQRIYLEFCSAGDLGDWLKNYIKKHVLPRNSDPWLIGACSPRNVPESELWCVFQCLARGALVMHHGSEDMSKQRFITEGELVHFDLKLDNVLIGEDTLDTEHRNKPPFKISDFGLARKVPSGSQDSAYRKQYEYYGTHPFYTPEQINNIFHNFAAQRPWTGLLSRMVPNPRYGTCSNIWQIGLIMQTLMRRPAHREPDWKDFITYASSLTPRLVNGGNTVGSMLDAEQDYTGSSIYSKELRALIAECLLLAPANRIPPAELVQRTADGVSAAQMSMGTILGTPLTEWAEPVLSAQWYSGQDEADSEQARLAAEFKKLQLQVEEQKNQRLRQVATQTAAAPAQQNGEQGQAGPPTPVQTAQPAKPASLAPISRLRVIVQTKPKFGLIGGGHKAFRLENLTPEMTVVQVKDMLERMGCGIKATGMNMMHGRTLMLNHQRLAEFPGIDVVRAMDA